MALTCRWDSLSARAASLQDAFTDLSMDVLDVVETADRLVLAFLMRGRHVGTFASAVGDVAATHIGRSRFGRSMCSRSRAEDHADLVVADDLGLAAPARRAELVGSCHDGGAMPPRPYAAHRASPLRAGRRTRRTRG